MDFVDNVIERATGTIRGRAQFANADGLFTPGMFARVAACRVGALRGAAGSRCRDRHRAGAQIRARGRRRQHRAAEIRDARRRWSTACASSRAASRPTTASIVNGLMRARPGGKVTPQEQSAPPQASRPAGEARKLTGAAVDDAHFAFLHRPADLRLGGVDRVRHSRRGRLFPPAGRAISGDRAADHQRHRPISRRQRRRRRRHRGRADRGADQRRREHDLHVVELDGGRPLHHLGHLRSRHQSRYRAGAGAEPRRDRAAAPAGRRARHRRDRAPRARPT